MRHVLVPIVALSAFGIAGSARAVDLADGLVAEWLFEEGEGNVVRDTSDNNNNGVLHNDPQWVDDGIGTALRFDGIDDYVDCGTTATIDLTETVSLEAWIKPEKPSTGEPLIAGKGIYAYGLTWSGSAVYFYVSDGAWKAVSPLPLRRWSHVVGTYDGKRMLLYVNGELASGFVMAEPNTPIKSRGSSAMIGRLAKAYYCGAVDNVRIYSRPLSRQEVEGHYEQERKRLKPPRFTPIDQLTGLARRVRELGGQTATLTIDSKQQVAVDLTVPPNVALQFASGGTLDVARDAVLTIEGPVAALATRVFTGAGRVSFLPGAVEHVYPHWWGAVGDGRADDAAAIQAAVDALPSGGTVRFRGGSFNIGSAIAVQNGIALQGPGSLRSRTALPALIRATNPAARTGGWRISRVRLNGRAVNGDRSAVGIDMTNVCSSLIEDVAVSSCDIGVKMDGPVFCGYNNLMRLSIGGCGIGIEMSNSTIKTSLFGSSIGAVDVGMSLKTTNELDAFGVSIEGFRTVGVDVLRATTTIAQALASGANSVYPAASEDEAAERVKKLSESGTVVLLCGEKGGLPIEGYDLGNSPRQYIPENVGGKDIVLLTTDGSRLLHAAAGAQRVIAAALVNAAAVGRYLISNHVPVVLVAAGTLGTINPEDLCGCGAVLKAMQHAGIDPQMNAACRDALEIYESACDDPLRFLRSCPNGRKIAGIGLGDDVTVCAQLNSLDIVPVLGEDGALRRSE